jgi:hypothetical protein
MSFLSKIFKPKPENLMEPPSSSLTMEEAMAMGDFICKTSGRNKGWISVRVGSTGSMLPELHNNVVVVMEPVTIDQIRVGDVVTVNHRQGHDGYWIIHTVFAKTKNGFWTKGRIGTDPFELTAANLDKRVVARIYAKLYT